MAASASLAKLTIAAVFSLCASSSFADDADPPLPRVAAINDTEYPAQARRLGQQGRLLVEFRITNSGKLSDPRVVIAVPSGMFEQATLRILRSISFEVPRTWSADGNDQFIFRSNIIFLLHTCGPQGPLPELTPLTTDKVITIRASQPGCPVG